MMRYLAFVGVTLIGAFGIVAPGLHAQNASTFSNWKLTALADTLQSKPRAACASLLTLTGYEFSVTTATAMSKSADLPDHCRVSGQIQPEIRFEVSLPTAWNGRLYMFGNGGYAGEALDDPIRVARAGRALSRGFAVAQMNTGHDAAVEPLGTFAVSPQKFLDYAYRGVHVTAITAKKILQTYYDAPVRRSYFDGCSTGGRQGLISAQRFPDDFDGIVVGAPVLDFVGTMLRFLVNQRALAATSIAPEKLELVSDAVYKKCDAADGVKDGLIDDPRKCAFRASVDLPRCTGDVDGPGCFTTAQLAALNAIYEGVNRNGVEVLPGWPVGSEIAAPTANAGVRSGWIPWFIGPPGARPTEATYGETFMKYVAFGRPNPSYDWFTFNFDTDLDKLQWTRGVLDATDSDLSRFRDRGGKIVSYFGWADPSLNPLMGVKYYESVTQRLGPSTPNFYRLFMVPGMFHCGGGIGASTFDAMTPLVEWVEKGTAPGSILGARIIDGKTVRTRPLCPYPEVAKHRGTGSLDEAANFACAKP